MLVQWTQERCLSVRGAQLLGERLCWPKGAKPCQMIHVLFDLGPKFVFNCHAHTLLKRWRLLHPHQVLLVAVALVLVVHLDEEEALRCCRV